MGVFWTGLVILAAAGLDAWYILRYRQHTLPAGLQHLLRRLRRWPYLSSRLSSPVRFARHPQFVLGLSLVLGGFWLFHQSEVYLRIARVVEWLDRLFHLGVRPLENTVLGIAALLLGGALVAWSLRSSVQAERPSSSRLPVAKVEPTSERAQAALLFGALLLCAVLLRVVALPTISKSLMLKLWLGALVFAGLALLAYDRDRGISLRLPIDRLDLGLLGLLLAAGLAVGSYRLAGIPSSMVGDEGAFWTTAKQIASGQASPNPFGYGVYSFPVASSYVQAAALQLFGLRLAAWRLASVIPSVLAAVPTYLLARLLFDRRIAVLSGGIMLATPYYLAFARLGYNNAQSMLPVALALYLLAVGLQRRSALALFAAGVVCGLGFYTYAAGRLGLVVACAILPLSWWRWGRHGMSPNADPTAKRHCPSIVILFCCLLLGWGLTIAPHLALGGAQQPEYLLHKTLEGLFANADYAGSAFSVAEIFRDHPAFMLGGVRLFYRPDLYARMLIGGTVRTALAFVHGRMIGSHYISGPLAGAWAAPFLIIGFARLITSLRRRGSTLVLVWFLAGAILLSAIDTYPPRHQHLIAVIPAMSILIAVGLATASDFLGAFVPGQRRVYAAILLLCGYAVIAVSGLHTYFVRAQRQYLPNFEDHIAFQALALEAPRTLLYVFDKPEQVDYVPWLIQAVPNQARYLTIAVEGLNGWRPDLRHGLTVFSPVHLYGQIWNWARAVSDQSPESEIFRDAEGRELGAAIYLGPGSPAPLPDSDKIGISASLSRAVLGLAALAWSALLAIVLYSRWRRPTPPLAKATDAQAQTAPMTRLPNRARAAASQLAIDLSSRARQSIRALLAGLSRLRATARMRSERAKPHPALRANAIAERDTPTPSLSPLAWPAVAFEMAILAGVVLLFSSQFLDFNPQKLLSGLEYGVMSHPAQVLRQSLLRDHVFPQWNPYIRLGHPFVADPFQYSFNPIVTVPVLLAGVANGFKLAVALSILLAAAGQWALGRVLGFNRQARLWSALVFALNGQALGRFLQGQYNFIFGYAWIPWILAGIVLSLRHQRRLHYALTALALALLYFSGTSYYPFYMGLLLILLTLALAFGGLHGGPRTIWRRIRPLITIGLLALVLAAVQLFPALQFRPYLSKPGDPQLIGSLTFGQAMLSFISDSTERPELLERLPPEEFYANIGPLACAAALLALGSYLDHRRRREVLTFLGLLLLSIGWATMRYTPFAALYREFELLNQFRYPSRALIFGTMALATLGGLGLTWALHRLSEDRRGGLQAFPSRGHRRGAATLAGLLMAFMVLSVSDQFRTNVRLMGLIDRPGEADVMASWIRQYDSGLYYLSVPRSTGWHDAIMSQGLRYLDAWYGFAFFPPGLLPEQTRPLRSAPNYLIDSSGLDPPFSDAVPIKEFTLETAYRIRDSLPFGFYVADATLARAAAEAIDRSEVVSLAVEELGPNRLRLRSDLERAEGWVVVRAAYFHGWKVLVDGEPAAVHPLAGLLAVRAVAGEHDVEFRFQSGTLGAGLVVSAYGLFLLLLFIAGDPVMARRLRHRLPWLWTWLERVDGYRHAAAEHLRRSATRTASDIAHTTWHGVRWVLRALSAVGAYVRGKGLEIAWVPFALSLAVYLATRLIRLEDFPIYFFADEAAQTVLASELVSNGFRDASGVAWPTYFQNGLLFNLSLSVYLQLLPTMLLPRSVFLTRAVPALVTATGAVAIGLLLKHGFRVRTWWAAPLLLGIVPIWFLHSRTAFEATLMVSMFAWFLYFYVRYLQHSPRDLLLALLFGGLAFYSYSPGQVIVVSAGLLLLFSDLGYHWQHRRSNLVAALWLGLLALPYVRFQLQNPGETYYHLRIVGSHWFQDLSLLEKLSQSAQLYLQALDPSYWFFPHERELIRHQMLGYAFIPTALLPLAIMGLMRLLRRMRSRPHRALIMVLLAAPTGAATAGLGITRVLAFIVPAIVLAGIGLEAIAARIKPAMARGFAGFGLVGGLTLASFGMLSDALQHGPTWYDNYGLYGLQYGARQLFGEIRTLLDEDPEAEIVLSPGWANGTNILLRYFMPDESPIRLEGGDWLLDDPRDDLEEMTFVLTPEEFQAVRDSPLFSEVRMLRTLPYPDGRPGFCFLRLRYAQDAFERFAQQAEQRRRPVLGEVEIDGQAVEVEHSPFDLGSLEEIFDGDPFTVARTLEANPAVLKLTFPTPRPLSGLTLTVSSMELSLSATAATVDREEPVSFSWDFYGLPPDPTVEVIFWDTPHLVTDLALQIHMREQDELAKVHIAELILR